MDAVSDEIMEMSGLLREYLADESECGRQGRGERHGGGSRLVSVPREDAWATSWGVDPVRRRPKLHCGDSCSYRNLEDEREDRLSVL